MGIPEYRKCNVCGKPMMSGFVVDAGFEYYCSEPCLHTRYTPEQWDEMYGDGETENYWTEWDENDDADENEDMEAI